MDLLVHTQVGGLLIALYEAYGGYQVVYGAEANHHTDLEYAMRDYITSVEHALSLIGHVSEYTEDDY